MTLTLPGPGLELSENIEQPKLTIESISTTAFVGSLNSPKAFEPTTVKSWTEFRTAFGDLSHPVSRAVFGFFDNGGSEAVVIDCGKTTEDSESAAIERWRRAVEVLDCEDAIGLVCIPGITDSLILELVEQHCAERKDRLLIIDADTASIQDRRLPDSNFVVAYHPWIEMIDPISGEPVTQAPSGHIAGLFARSEAQRGIQTAPANAKLHGVRALTRRFSRRKRQQLFAEGINLIRDDSNRGGEIRVWGAKIHSQTAQWQSISTRRIHMMISRAIAIGTQWVVHKRNDQLLRSQLTEQLSTFLEELRLAGILAGDSAREAFYVKCDDEFNPVEQIGSDQVIFEIGVCPVRPKEFTLLRFCQWPGGLEIAE